MKQTMSVLCVFVLGALPCAQAQISISDGKNAVKVDLEDGKVKVKTDKENETASDESAAEKPSDGEPLKIEASNLKKTFECKGQSVEVIGSENVIILKGHVKELEIPGAENSVTVDKVDEISISGTENKVVWKEGPDSDSKPEIDVAGADNTVEQLK